MNDQSEEAHLERGNEKDARALWYAAYRNTADRIGLTDSEKEREREREAERRKKQEK